MSLTWGRSSTLHIVLQSSSLQDFHFVLDICHSIKRWHGKDRVKFLETLVVGDIAGLKEGEARLSLVTNKDGGIIDDTIITNAGDYT